MKSRHIISLITTALMAVLVSCFEENPCRPAESTSAAYSVCQMRIAGPEDSDKSVPASMPPFISASGDTLFYQNGQDGPLMAFKSVDFKKIWERPVSGHETSLLMLDNDMLFFDTLNARNAKAVLTAFAARDGSVRWKAYPERNGSTNSRNNVLLAGNVLIKTGWDSISAFDKNTGVPLWEGRYDYYKDRIIEHTTAEPGEGPSSEPVYWGVGSHVYALDPTTGKIEWNMTIDRVAGFMSTPLSDGDTGLMNEILRAQDGIVVFSSYLRRQPDSVFAIDVRKRAVKWEHDSYDQPLTPVHDKKEVLLAHGKEVLNLDAETGREIWKTILPDSAETSCSMNSTEVYCNSRLSSSDYKPQGAVYALSRATGKLLWSHPTKGRHVNPPVIRGGRVYAVAPEKGERDPSGVVWVFDSRRP